MSVSIFDVTLLISKDDRTLIAVVRVDQNRIEDEQTICQ